MEGEELEQYGEELPSQKAVSLVPQGVLFVAKEGYIHYFFFLEKAFYKVVSSTGGVVTTWPVCVCVCVYLCV